MSRQLTAVVHRGLKLDPAKRWPSVNAFAEALKEVAHSEQVLWEQMDAMGSSQKARKAPRAQPVEKGWVKTLPMNKEMHADVIEVRKAHEARQAVALAATVPQAEASDEGLFGAPEPSVPEADASTPAATASAHEMEPHAIDDGATVNELTERRASADNTRTLLMLVADAVILAALIAAYALSGG